MYIASLLALLALAACGRLDSIPSSPAQTPASWLEMQPFVTIRLASRDLIVVQPSTTIIVYLLGLLALGAGIVFLATRHDQRSRGWWGIALLLWGLGALAAGTSYEGFSYQIKCAGREVCQWTSWWEVVYLMLSVASIDAMMIAGAYAGAGGRGRKAIAWYAVLHATGYAAVVLIGALTPVKLLLSFELLVVAAAPTVLALFLLNLWRYRTFKEGVDLALTGGWTWLALTLAAYYGYLVLDITAVLWARGVWFSENDVLHLGLIAWVVYLVLVVAPRVKDRSPGLDFASHAHRVPVFPGGPDPGR